MGHTFNRFKLLSDSPLKHEGGMGIFNQLLAVKTGIDGEIKLKEKQSSDMNAKIQQYEENMPVVQQQLADIMKGLEEKNQELADANKKLADKQAETGKLDTQVRMKQAKAKLVDEEIKGLEERKKAAENEVSIQQQKKRELDPIVKQQKASKDLKKEELKNIQKEMETNADAASKLADSIKRLKGCSEQIFTLQMELGTQQVIEGGPYEKQRAAKVAAMKIECLRSLSDSEKVQLKSLFDQHVYYKGSRISELSKTFDKRR